MGRTRRRGMDQNAAQEAINSAIEAAGGILSHNELVEQLDAAGKGEAGNFLLSLQQSGNLYAQVSGVPDSKPVLKYSLTPFGQEGGE